MDLSQVKFVALYLRKSRGDDESALDKHRTELVELAERHQWRYEHYEEIGSSDSIDWRPEMQRLLKEVSDNIYDAVLVMDLDRLSRGDLADQARWRKAFEETGTLIVTPSKVYDLTTDETALMADIEGLFARHEYRMIVKRLRQGKRIGAKMGRWTNGPAPMPYRYDSVTRRLEVDPQQLPIYDLIKQRLLENHPLYAVMAELNHAGIPSPQGKLWNITTIYRLAMSEVHLGRIVQGKSTGSGHKNKKAKQTVKKPRDEWVVVQGTHQPVKTEEEHRRILELFQRRSISPLRSRNSSKLLSGMIRCGVCGASMQILSVPKSDRYEVRKCLRIDAFGNKCQNRGCKLYVIVDHVKRFLDSLEADLVLDEQRPEYQDQTLPAQIAARQAEVETLEQGTSRIEDLYVMGRITKAELAVRLAKHDRRIQQAREELSRLRQIQASTGTGLADRLKRTRSARAVMSDPATPPEVINRVLRQLITQIVYTREQNQINVNIEVI